MIALIILTSCLVAFFIAIGVAFGSAISGDDNELFDKCNCDPYFLNKGFHSNNQCKVLKRNLEKHGVHDNNRR